MKVKNFNRFLFLIISATILLLSFVPIVLSDFGSIRNTEKFTLINEDIKVFQNGSALVELYIEINDTEGDNSHFEIELIRQNQNFTYISCNDIVIKYFNGTIDRINKPEIQNIPLYFFKERRFVWFNHTEPAEIRINCYYNIKGYADEITPTKWFIYDEFQNKHSAKRFFLTISIPKNNAFTETIPQPYLRELCNENDGCGEKISYNWETGIEYVPPILYLKYEKINPSYLETTKLYFTQYFLSGLIGAIIALSLGIIIKKIISILKIEWSWFLNQNVKKPKNQNNRRKSTTKYKRKSTRNSRKNKS